MTTKIDYLDETWSPITGCSGKNCKAHCWAQDMVRRFPKIHEGEGLDLERGDSPLPFPTVHFHPDRLDKPLHWKKPRRVGVCYTGDWMDNQVEKVWIYQILEVISKCPQHLFFTLTKQPQNLPERLTWWINDHHYQGCIPNLRHGVSITDQEDADRIIPELLKVPGKHWLSWEPAIGPFDFAGDDGNQPWYSFENEEGTITPGIDWLVMGCESGPKRRPCPHIWMIDVVRQCKAAGVPVWVKQVDMGKRVSHNPAEWPEELRVREI